MRRKLKFRIALYSILSISYTVNGQNFCDFINKVQDYQQSVKINDSGDILKIDTSTFNTDFYIKLFDKLKVASPLKCETIYLDYMLGGEPALILFEDSLNIENYIAKRVENVTQDKNIDSENVIRNALYELSDSTKRIVNNIIYENNEDGIFQYLFFNQMGENFALSWHSNYDEKYVLCSKKQLTHLIKPFLNNKLYTVERKSYKKLLKKNIEPQVQKVESNYIITWFVLKTHKGIYKQTFAINDSNPYKIEKIKSEQVVKIDINFLY
ncbi:hypothetical protein [Saccharicrinis sp. FJH54]|uniref:hypothetical protein n=1 Tax=Saccharicrinis sp. FJH54 TaxID=3344665 RepID=UPI0035D4CE79